MTVTSAAAQTRTPGVSEGDQFTYGDITVEWSTDHPNQTIYPSLEAMNQTESLTLSVKDVSDTNITCELTQHFRDGTEETQQGYIDVDTGDSENITSLPLPFISKDLAEDDDIYDSEAFAGGKINETVTRTYPDETRETNHLNFTREQSMEDQFQFMASNYYWDKPTGTLMEVSEESIYEAGGYTTSYTVQVKITQSNKWSIPEFPTVLLLPLLMIATLLTTIAIRRKLKATPERKRQK
ncbi:MAG: hypothetical protein ACOC6H_04980 [Thermoproteota archaeon]